MKNRNWQTNKQDNKIVSKLVNFDKNLLSIPSVSIHFNRNANDNATYSLCVDMFPTITQIAVVDKIGKKTSLQSTLEITETTAVIGLKRVVPKPPENSLKVIKKGKHTSTVLLIFSILSFADKNTVEIICDDSVTTKHYKMKLIIFHIFL